MQHAGGWLASWSRMEVLLAVVVVAGIMCGEARAVIGEHPRVRGSAAEIEGPRLLQPVLVRIRQMPERSIGDARAAGIVAGIVLGRTDGIDADAQERFRRAGLWHLMAASGQNVALVVAICTALAFACGAGRLAGCCWALVTVPAYVLVVGGGPSIVRAGIMAELAVLAWMAGRRTSLRHALLVSAALIVWAWPGVHRSLGFQLSYACVVALACWAAPFAEWLERRSIPRWLAGGIAATATCTAATAPILVLATGTAPLAAGALNLVAVPLAGAILVLGLPGCVLGLVHGGWEAAPLTMCGLLARGVDASADVAILLPLSCTRSMAVAASLPTCAAALHAGLHRRLGLRRCILVAGGAAGILLLASVLQSAHARQLRPGPGHARIVMLDVGQGMATLVTANSHAVLVDAGARGAAVGRQLHRLGIRSLDGVVVSHDAIDHRGGLGEVIDEFHPAWVGVPRWMPGSTWKIGSGIRVVQLCDGDVLGAGQLLMVVRNPPCAAPNGSVTGDRANDNGVVLVVSHGAVRALLPGDAEASVTARLDVGPIDLLAVAHHGSSDPALPSLVASTRPSIAAISVGAGNPFGHPRSDTIAALEHGGAIVVRTDRSGMLSFDSDGQSLRLHRR